MKLTTTSSKLILLCLYLLSSSSHNSFAQCVESNMAQNTGNTVSGHSSAGQGFTASCAGDITAVTVVYNGAQSVAGDRILNIRDGGLPTSPVIHTQIIPSGSVVIGSNVFTLTAPVPINLSELNAWEITQTVPVNTSAEGVAHNPGGLYPGGEAWFSGSVLSSYDLTFEVEISSACTATSIAEDVAQLPVVNDECSVSIATPPTATNDCGTVINGVSSEPFPITTQGTTLITWTYDDGMGNITSQTQDVIILDVSAPVADSTSLTDLTDMCNVGTVIPPTATDNCAGQIIGTTTTVFPVITTGSSVITWTFDDGQGNISTQTQNIVNGAIDTGITQIETLLYADALASTYQWLDCDADYAIIAGEVNQFYEPVVTGTYAVEITQSGCIDTSACVLIDFTSVGDLQLQDLTIYPNPTIDWLFVETTENPAGSLIMIYDLKGKIVLRETMNSQLKKINVSSFDKGMYFLQVGDNKMVKFIKE
jgi:Secretion system C-terminal sorting domain